MVALYYVVVMLIVFFAMYAFYNRNSDHRRRWEIPDKNHLLNTIENALFFRKLNAYDLKARNADSIEAYLQTYKKSLRVFTDSEAAMLDLTIEESDRALHDTKYLARIPWKIACFEGVEENFPHTIGDVILLPKVFFSYDKQKRIETLIHEKIHVYQRKHPIETSMLLESLGMRPWKPQRLFPNIRTNPDTNDFVYELRNTAQAQIYDVEEPDSISRSSTKVVNGTEPWEIPDSIKQRDHPYEIMACGLAQLLTTRKDPYEGSLSDWAERHL